MIATKEKINDNLFLSVEMLEKTDETSSAALSKQNDSILLCFEVFNAHKSATHKYRLAVRFSGDYFMHYTDFDAQNISTFTDQKICGHAAIVIFEILDCRLEGLFRKIFIESKLLMLFYQTQRSHTTAHHGHNPFRFLEHNDQKQKIETARQIILKNLSNPPTITELAAQVGTNACYLKQGFKQIFGSTIHSFVQKQRLEKAKNLLSKKNTSILEIAETIGYSNVSSFSLAFRQQFGITPSQFIKSM
jgi:AraC-like DNA-binding protein